MSDRSEYIRQAFQQAFETAGVEARDAADMKWIIFSDLHRGQGDGADDFLSCKAAYHAALGYYLDAGYELILLGDVEDLWECYPSRINRVYRDTLELEKQFADRGRYMRFIGNHDDLWEDPRQVRRHLHRWIGDAPLYNTRRFTVRINGRNTRTLFLAHGHQGHLANDRLRWLSRLWVRYALRNGQRLLRVRATTPSSDFCLRGEQEAAIYQWAAAQEGVMVICGDTHHPVFASEYHTDDIAAQIRRLRRKWQETSDAGERRRISEDIHFQCAEMEWVKAKSGELRMPGDDPKQRPKPCYFNSGCCSFADGDVTGIEIAGGEIRLVRWPDAEGRPRRKVLQRADFRKLLRGC